MHQPAWSLLESGQRLPTRAQAFDIERATVGEIPASAWPRKLPRRAPRERSVTDVA
jgi:hypothetical protein